MKFISALPILLLSTIATFSEAGRVDRFKGSFSSEIEEDDVEHRNLNVISGKKGGMDGDGYGGKKGGMDEDAYGGKKGVMNGYGDGYGGKKGGMDGGMDGDGYGGKKGGYSGKKGGNSNSCDLCALYGKPTSVTLMYVADGKNSKYQGAGKASCREKQYPDSATVKVNYDEEYEVEYGSIITVEPEGRAETIFQFYSDNDSSIASDECYIHTSCSVPLMIGDQIGPWKVLTNDGEDDDDCEKECVVCDSFNKNRPDSLIMRYHTDGADSMYQGAGKASCRAGTYPDDVQVTAAGQTFTLTDGQRFALDAPFGRFGAETFFDFDGSVDDDCYIHTSCSVPIVPGDKIGPFEIIGGNDCIKDDPCIEATVKEDEEGNNIIEVTFDYSDLKMDRPFVDNCDSRDENCPITDLTPLASDWVGFYPCEASIDSLPFSVEPSVWAYTCYDRDCRRGTDATPKATVTFSDETIPAFGSQGIYNKIEDLSGCYVVLLNRIDGFSAPPYYNLCMGNEIFL